MYKWFKRVSAKKLSNLLNSIPRQLLILSFWCSWLKGTVSPDFWLLVFSWIIFPKAPEYTIMAVSNFFDNLRRYSQLNVHHRCHWHQLQMEIFFKHKSFNYLLWEVELTYRFLPSSSLWSQQPDIVPTICHECHYRWQICHWCNWYRWCTLTCEYLCEFWKKLETVQMGYSGAGGKLIH